MTVYRNRTIRVDQVNGDGRAMKIHVDIDASLGFFFLFIHIFASVVRKRTVHALLYVAFNNVLKYKGSELFSGNVFVMYVIIREVLPTPRSPTKSNLR